MGKGRLVVLSGPSGAGKNTVYDALKEKAPDIAKTVSATTRSPRQGEIDGEDYYFISLENFLSKIENGDFVEYVRYGDNYYGTLKSEVKRLLELEKTVVMVIEVNGAAYIKEAFPGSFSIFILPPSMEELERRLNERGQNTPEETARRLAIAYDELSQKDKYDHRVVNDDLDECVKQIYRIIFD